MRLVYVTVVQDFEKAVLQPYERSAVHDVSDGTSRFICTAGREVHRRCTRFHLPRHADSDERPRLELKPLGNPVQNAPRHFAIVHILKLASDPAGCARGRRRSGSPISRSGIAGDIVAAHRPCRHAERLVNAGWRHLQLAGDSSQTQFFGVKLPDLGCAATDRGEQPSSTPRALAAVDVSPVQIKPEIAPRSSLAAKGAFRHTSAPESRSGETHSSIVVSTTSRSGQEALILLIASTACSSSERGRAGTRQFAYRMATPNLPVRACRRNSS